MVEFKAVRFLVLDVDGVLTDGSIIVDDLGIEAKRFHVRDGFAITAAQKVGLKIGVLTGRNTRAVNLRTLELHIGYVLQGATDKGSGLAELCEKAGVGLEQTAFMGDDLLDLPALRRCGFPIAVADAVDEVREVARFVTAARGGRGAVREAIEHILEAQGLWRQIVNSYMQ